MIFKISDFAMCIFNDALPFNWTTAGVSKVVAKQSKEGKVCSVCLSLLWPKYMYMGLLILCIMIYFEKLRMLLGLSPFFFISGLLYIANYFKLWLSNSNRMRITSDFSSLRKFFWMKLSSTCKVCFLLFLHKAKFQLFVFVDWDFNYNVFVSFLLKVVLVTFVHLFLEARTLRFKVKMLMNRSFTTKNQLLEF